MTRSRSLLVAAAALAASALIQPDAFGQGGAAPLPGYPPVLQDVRLVFPTQADSSLRPVEHYLQIIDLPRTSPLHLGPTWTFYAPVEPLILDSAQRLWSPGHFRSVWVDALDDPFPNGASAKRVTLNVVERTLRGPTPVGLPEPPPGFELPPPSHEQLYPPRKRAPGR